MLDSVLTSILSAASSALTAAGVPARLVSLVPGAVTAWDDCCTDGSGASGQLTLRIVEVYPSGGRESRFPALDSVQSGGCSPVLLAVRLGLGVVRCAHTVQDDGSFPTADQMTDDALGMIDDMNLILNVIVCDIPTISGIQAVKLGEWLPEGPQGGCAGGEWTFVIGVDPCVCRD